MQRHAPSARERPSRAALGVIAFAAAFALFAIHVAFGNPGWVSPSPADLRVHSDPAREAWLATWMPAAEDEPQAGQAARDEAELAPIGRPLQQLGVGPALWVSGALIRLADPEPEALYRWMRLLAGALSGLFAFLLLRASGLRAPLAGLAAALASGPTWVHGAQLGPSVLWTLATALAALWATHRIVARGSGWSTVALALALHTGAIVAPLPHAFETLALVAGFAILVAAGVSGWSERTGRLGYVLLASLLAALSALPIQAEQRRTDDLAQVPAEVLATTAERARLPRLFPLGTTVETAPGKRTVELYSDELGPREATGPITLRWERTDARRLDLPRLRGKHLLVLKKLYHPRWRASFRGRHMDTVCVNGIFQGVIVVPTFRFAEMSFNSVSPLVLLSQWFFAAALLAWLGAWLWQRFAPQEPLKFEA